MEPVDVLLLMLIGGILGLAIRFVIKSKKKGNACIGCPEKGCSGCTRCKK